MIGFNNDDMDDIMSKECSSSDIQDLEESLNVKLPFLFRKFLEKFSGKVLLGNEAITIELPDERYITIDAILSIDRIHPLVKIMESKFSEENKFIPFAVTSLGDYLCLDASFSREYPVVLISMSLLNITKIALSFEQFVRVHLGDKSAVESLSEGKLIQKEIVPYKDVNTNSANLNKMEELVGNMQMKEISQIFPILEAIRKQLNREFNCTCEDIRITNNTGKSFYGAAIYPTIDECNKLATQIVTSVGTDGKVKFESCKKFIIDLDSKLIYDIGATPREIVAVILHELGHIVFNKEAVLRNAARVSTTLITQTANLGAILFKVISPLKFLLFQAIIIGLSSTFELRNAFKDEQMADSLAVRYGYGADLYSVITKITDHGLAKKTKEEKKKEDQLVCNWSVTNLLMFNSRKRKIESDLKKMLKNKELSTYERNIIQYQLEQISKYKGSSNLQESLNSGYNKEMVLQENLQNFLKDTVSGKYLKEFDVLRIEMDSIEDQEDKMYVTLRIHKLRKTALNYQAELTKLYEKGKMTESEYNKKYALIDTYLEELEEIRKECIKIKIKEKKYGVFAKIGIDEYDAL